MCAVVVRSGDDGVDSSSFLKCPECNVSSHINDDERFSLLLKLQSFSGMSLISGPRILCLLFLCSLQMNCLNLSI